MAQKIVLLGAGGLARDVVDIFQARNESGAGEYELLGYITDKNYGEPGTLVYNKPILGDFEWLKSRIDQVSVVCSVGTSELRYQLVERAKKLGANFQNAIHPQAVISPGAQIGSGVIIKAGCLIASQVSLGNHVVLNLGCTIGHDTLLGDFVTVAAGVNIAGYVKVGLGSYLAIGCKVIERLEIGEGVFIGGGSVVTKNIPPNMVAAGFPARAIKPRPENEGWNSQNSKPPETK